MVGDRPTLDSGIARYGFHLIDELVALGCPHPLTVFVAEGFVPPRRWGRPGCLEIARPQGRWRRQKTLWELFRAPEEIRRRKIDVWLSTAQAVPFGTGARKALVAHDLFPITHGAVYTLKQRLVMAAALRSSVRRADLLLANSRHTRDELIRVLAVPAGRIEVVYLGGGDRGVRRDPATVSDEELARLGVGPEPFLLTLSTLEPRKNLGRLFEALALLVRSGRFPRLSLAVAGSAGWKSRAILRRPAALGIESHVRFLGYVEDADLPALFARCAAFVQPAVVEGFGIPVLEALALGAPVVCSATGALPEVAGDVATYFDPLDPADMARAIGEVLLRPVTRAEQAAAGESQAARFSWRTTARETLAHLERLAERRS